MGRDLMLEHQRSLPYTLYKNSFLFYRYQFEDSDVHRIGLKSDFITRRKIIKSISKQIKQFYNNHIDCYMIRMYQKLHDDIYAVEVMVRLLNSVVIPTDSYVSIIFFTDNIFTHIFQILLSNDGLDGYQERHIKLFPAYYKLHNSKWIQAKLNHRATTQYRHWYIIDSQRWPVDEDRNFEEFNPLLHHIDDNIWVELGKLTIVKPSEAYGVESENLGFALDNLNADVEQVICEVDSEDDSETLIIHYSNSIVITI